MSQYQLRVYTLSSPEALGAYESVWSKHIPGMAKHRITTHGIWTVTAAPGTEAPQLCALVSYRDADDVQERLAAYLASPEFRADMEGFDISQIVDVAESVLTPTGDSPLR
ncbi:NIPSNAP family protein [Streptomyces sp. AM8-1-1]|uniref:NIPSNAP family protein n=1 Tax=Streptomyces sp. AM8-1-1 TaxID=3075825 RepID=UPI0028C4B16D|nr:NIPSNAP family protein [Streptomyces sp. AM8-1-1]WNO76868.1 NIPSNAP family protein [Streptomyces sp. AM8-1-1]